MNFYEESLKKIQEEIATRPNNRAITSIISRHISKIDNCLEYGYTRKNIYDLIFSDDDKQIISLKYFNDGVLYRARKKSIKNPHKNDESIDKPKPQIDTQSTNAFEKLLARQKAREESSFKHNPGSSMEDVENSFARIALKSS